MLLRKGNASCHSCPLQFVFQNNYNVFTSYPSGHAVRVRCCATTSRHRICGNRQEARPSYYVCGGLSSPATSKGETIGGRSANQRLPGFQTVMVNEIRPILVCWDQHDSHSMRFSSEGVGQPFSPKTLSHTRLPLWHGSKLRYM